ncbi:hypothetical protein AMTR_s00030p00173530 [Amborella trichopoda]|uniref:Uncharacterized protein n=1 Tax=Amborella trichopoda TaxID=13333 RepID=U5D6X5_AMBTC|nr:hypothetical protein AMTR_s00030p00173530 [Amborella trichopoda]
MTLVECGASFHCSNLHTSSFHHGSLLPLGPETARSIEPIWLLDLTSGEIEKLRHCITRTIMRSTLVYIRVEIFGTLERHCSSLRAWGGAGHEETVLLRTFSESELDKQRAKLDEVVQARGSMDTK